MHRDVLSYLLVNQIFDGFELCRSYLFEMIEIKAQVIRSDERALLMGMHAKHAPQGLMDDVRRRVISHYIHAMWFIYPRIYLLSGSKILSGLDDMDRDFSRLLRIKHQYFLIAELNFTDITNL